MKKRLWITILLGCLHAVPGSALAEVYRWVDEHGNVHFGDRPSGEQAEAVELDERALNVQEVSGERLEQQKKILDAYAEERRVRKEQAAQAAAQAEERRQACHEVRDQLRQMRDGGFVWYDLDAAGNRVYLDEATVRSQISSLEARERTVCE